MANIGKKILNKIVSWVRPKQAGSSSHLNSQKGKRTEHPLNPRAGGSSTGGNYVQKKDFDPMDMSDALYRQFFGRDKPALSNADSEKLTKFPNFATLSDIIKRNSGKVTNKHDEALLIKKFLDGVEIIIDRSPWVGNKSAPKTSLANCRTAINSYQSNVGRQSIDGAVEDAKQEIEWMGSSLVYKLKDAKKLILMSLPLNIAKVDHRAYLLRQLLITLKHSKSVFP